MAELTNPSTSLRLAVSLPNLMVSRPVLSAVERVEPLTTHQSFDFAQACSELAESDGEQTCLERSRKS